MNVPTLGGLDWQGPERDALEADFWEALDAALDPALRREAAKAGPIVRKFAAACRASVEDERPGAVVEFEETK